MIFIGIDPGITGAVAFVDGTTGVSSVFDLPLHQSVRRIDGLKLAMLIREHAPASIGGCVVLEELHARASGGGMQQMGSMMKTVGIILGAIDCTRFPLLEVTPQKWKRFYGLGSDKSKSLERARILFPERQPDLQRAKDDGRAEALLIAHWAIRNKS